MVSYTEHVQTHGRETIVSGHLLPDIERCPLLLVMFARPPVPTRRCMKQSPDLSQTQNQECRTGRPRTRHLSVPSSISLVSIARVACIRTRRKRYPTVLIGRQVRCLWRIFDQQHRDLTYDNSIAMNPWKRWLSSAILVYKTIRFHVERPIDHVNHSSRKKNKLRWQRHCEERKSR